MGHMITFTLGTWFGVFLMCLMKINKKEEDRLEKEYFDPDDFMGEYEDENV